MFVQVSLEIEDGQLKNVPDVPHMEGPGGAIEAWAVGGGARCRESRWS